MKKRIFTASALAFGLLLGSCSDSDDTIDKVKADNLTLNLSGLETLGADFEYEGWVIVDGAPVSTGTFDVENNGESLEKSFYVDADMLAKATAFVLSIEPAVDEDPAPAPTKMLVAGFTDNVATVNANVVPGINPMMDADFSNASGSYFLRTPTDETDGNNGNDENGIWFGMPAAPPMAGFEGMPELDEASGWRYEGWVVVDGTPISTGTFTKFNDRDSSNMFSGAEANAGPPVPGEDFFLNAPEGVDFPLDVRGKTAVISLEPYPDNSTKPFSIKPLVSMVAEDAGTAPTVHTFGANLASFPSGTITRK